MMNEDLRAGRREMEPMKAYYHTAKIKQIFERARKQAWLEMMKEVEVQTMVAEQNRIELQNRRRRRESTQLESLIQMNK